MVKMLFRKKLFKYNSLFIFFFLSFSFIFFVFSTSLSSCSLKNFASKIFLEEDLLQEPPAERCGSCHKDIHKDFKNSRHAVAWVSEHFKKESKNYTDEKCLPCHAAKPIWASSGFQEEPELREKHVEDGIYCVTCHFDPHRKGMVGPYEVWSPPHPSFQDKKIKSSELCGVCHQETYSEWLEAKVEKTCSDCHMPKVGRKHLTQKPPMSWFHSKQDVFSHEFPALIAKKEDIKVKVARENGNFILQLENIGVPHKLPTADQGNPKLYISLHWENGEKETTVLSPQQENSLEYQKPVSFIFEDKGGKVKIEIKRRLSWKEEADLISSLTY
jgi:hypothetical protein